MKTWISVESIEHTRELANGKKRTPNEKTRKEQLAENQHMHCLLRRDKEASATSVNSLKHLNGKTTGTYLEMFNAEWENSPNTWRQEWICKVKHW